MVNDYYAAYFSKLESTCASYLEEQPRLRNAIMSFYSAILAFYIKYSSAPKTITFGFGTIILTLFGVICLISIIGLRSWSVQYIKCIKVINGLILSEESFHDYNAIQYYIAFNLEHSEKVERKSLVTGIGNLIVLGFTMLTTIPVFYYVSILYTHITIWVIFIELAYCAFFEVFLYRKLKQGEKYKTWILTTPPQHNLAIKNLLTVANTKKKF